MKRRAFILRLRGEFARALCKLRTEPHPARRRAASISSSRRLLAGLALDDASGVQEVTRRPG